MAKNVLLAFASFVLTLFACEFVLEYASSKPYQALSDVASVCTFATYSSGGAKVSHGDGELKLVLHPAYIVGNYPS